MTETAAARDQLTAAVAATLHRITDRLPGEPGRATTTTAYREANLRVDQLTGSDRELAAAAAAATLTWCWTVGALDTAVEPDTAWWATPLGRLTAAALPDADDSVTVRVADAAAMLNVDPSRIQQLIGDGRLRRSGRGRVVRGDVVRYLRGQGRR